MKFFKGITEVTQEDYALEVARQHLLYGKAAFVITGDSKNPVFVVVPEELMLKLCDDIEEIYVTP